MDGIKRQHRGVAKAENRVWNSLLRHGIELDNANLMPALTLFLFGLLKFKVTRLCRSAASWLDSLAGQLLRLLIFLIISLFHKSLRFSH